MGSPATFPTFTGWFYAHFLRNLQWMRVKTTMLDGQNAAFTNNIVPERNSADEGTQCSGLISFSHRTEEEQTCQAGFNKS